MACVRTELKTLRRVFTKEILDWMQEMITD